MPPASLGGRRQGRVRWGELYTLVSQLGYGANVRPQLVLIVTGCAGGIYELFYLSLWKDYLFLLGLAVVLWLALRSPIVVIFILVLLIATWIVRYDSPERQMRKGAARYAANDYAGAISAYSQAILRNPSAAAYAYRGQARLAYGTTRVP